MQILAVTWRSAAVSSCTTECRGLTNCRSSRSYTGVGWNCDSGAGRPGLAGAHLSTAPVVELAGLPASAGCAAAAAADGPGVGSRIYYAVVWVAVVVVVGGGAGCGAAEW